MSSLDGWEPGPPRGRMDIAEARSNPRERARIADLMGMVPDGLAIAADIGARDGFLSMALTHKVDRVVALDLVAPTVDHPRVTAVTGDATGLGFADRAFDLVLCAEVLEHFASPKLEIVCRELVRVSRRYVLIGVPFEQDTRFGRLTCQACGHGNPPWGHVSTFDQQRLEQLFAPLVVKQVSFSGAGRSRTNFVSTALNDWAGNPWGPYWQEESCVACGARFVAPTRRSLLQRAASKSAFWINAVQQAFAPERPIWIHMLFARENVQGTAEGRYPVIKSSSTVAVSGRGRLQFKTRLAAVARMARTRLSESRLSEAVKTQVRLDDTGVPLEDPGTEVVISATLQWLSHAQDQSASADGGVARDYSLRDGWSTSYPETTGYIIPTLLDHAEVSGDIGLRDRAEKMLRWLVDIQMPCGAIQGGKIGLQPVVPVPFNTGQVLLGFASGEKTFGGLRASLRKAADWLVEIQGPEGCWREFPSPFAVLGAKTYDTHIAWGLFEAERIEPGRGYEEAALANVRWALTHQRDNGWFDYCCLSDFSRPLTHTIGYALRGVIEAYRFSRDPRLLQAAQRTADGVLTALRSDGFLPGQLAADWSAAADWSCLTGSVQLGYCWLALFQETGDPRYRDAGFAANAYVRRTVALGGSPDTRGAVRGSFPIDGSYCRYAYPSWAAKFLVDSLALERLIRSSPDQVRVD